MIFFINFHRLPKDVKRRNILNPRPFVKHQKARLKRETEVYSEINSVSVLDKDNSTADQQFDTEVPVMEVANKISEMLLNFAEEQLGISQLQVSC